MQTNKAITSLYLHFPYCKHLCNYCDFYKKKFDAPRTQIQDFHSQLEAQWEQHQKLLEDQSHQLGKLETLYFGGGTPSLWGTSGAEYFKNEFLDKKIVLNSDCEFTMEIDPQSWSEGGLNKWIDLGVNRLSIGTQSFNPKFIEIMDRGHNFEEVIDLLDFAQYSKQKFTVDFMLGLPFSQDYKRDVIEEVKQILQYEPTHLSLYILSTRKNYPHNSHLPDDEYIAEEYMKVADYLKSQGFDHYEVSNFGKGDHYSKHNLKYWQYESVAAIGPNATGLLVGEKTLRYQWKSGSLGYQIEELDKKAVLLEKVYLALRTNRGLAPDDLNLDLSTVSKEWGERGLLQENSSTIKLNSQGFLLLDSLMDDLFKRELL